MSTVPDSYEWDTSKLPKERRDYLDGGQSFEAIAESVAIEIARLAATETKVTKENLEAWIEPSKNTYKGARQVIFRIRVSPRTYDLLYNAPDGLRGRYWQSPDKGSLATRYLIDLLKSTLLGFAKANPPQLKSKKMHDNEMTLDDVCISLEAPSAKVWIRERADNGDSIIAGGPQLIVRRWKKNEADPRGKGQQWCDTPSDGWIEIKGALIDSQGVEHVPESKWDRCWQIHHFGFT